MKTPTPIKGVLVALIAGLLFHVYNTASYEVCSIVFGCVLAIGVGILGIRYRRASNRDEFMIRHGLQHYRTHIHNRKVVRKTS